MSQFHVVAELTDAPDGLSRLMLDVSRFGLDLQSVAMRVDARGIAQTRLCVRLETPTDCTSLAARLTRHHAVSTLEVNPVTDPTEE